MLIEVQEWWPPYLLTTLCHVLIEVQEWWPSLSTLSSLSTAVKQEQLHGGPCEAMRICREDPLYEWKSVTNAQFIPMIFVE